MTTSIDANDAEAVLDVAEYVYRDRLDDRTGGGKDSVKKMIAKDGDGGVALRVRARSYMPIIRAVLKGYELHQR